jgi:peptidoglycan hydrolase CwlO-like protein
LYKAQKSIGGDLAASLKGQIDDQIDFIAELEGRIAELEGKLRKAVEQKESLVREARSLEKRVRAPDGNKIQK